MDVTYNFTAGTRAVAGQVNQNFADVKSAIDPLQTDVADIKTQLTSGIVLPDGSVDFTRLQSYKTYTVSNATNATPIVITAVAHDFITGDKVYISGVGGNTAANGTFTITKISSDTFSLDGSVGNGAFTTNGTAVIYPSADKNLAHKAYVDNKVYPTLSTSDMPIMANNSSDANNDIDFSAGFCWDDTLSVKLTGVSMTKRLDEIWAAGTNKGGLDTGAKSISTQYFEYIISKADGTTDYLISNSPTSPTMPTGFIYKRRIGSFTRTDSSNNIIKKIQDGDTFYYKSFIRDVDRTTSISLTDLILSVPPSTTALLRTYISNSNVSAAELVVNAKFNITTFASTIAAVNQYALNDIEVLTDSSSKIQYSLSATVLGARIYTIGYIDKRGKK